MTLLLDSSLFFLFHYEIDADTKKSISLVQMNERSKQATDVLNQVLTPDFEFSAPE